MTWLALLKAALIAAGAFAGWLRERRLLEAGRAEGLADHLKRALDEIALAEKARRDVRSDIARDLDSLRRDDGFRRRD